MAIPSMSEGVPSPTPHDDPGRSIGRRIGPYVITGLIGHGGMGVVYRGERQQPTMAVAIKLIRGGRISAGERRRFEVEQEALAQLAHPGIARLYDAGEADLGDGPQPYLVMELVSGTPLTEYAAGRRVRGTAEPLTLRARLELLARVVEAVQHAHQKPIIHRDLKPDNILVTDEGQPKVLDFGLARVSADEPPVAAPTSAAGGAAATPRRPAARGDAHTAAGGGTLAYMSPEQTRGDPSHIDIRTDVYTLGVIAYELLAGRLPYGLPRERHRLGEAFRIIQAVVPPPLAGRRASSTARAAWGGSSSAANGPRQGQALPDMSTLVASDAPGDGSPARVTAAPPADPDAAPLAGPRFPDDVEAIVARAMRKDRNERYASAGALAADIHRYLAVEPVEAHPRFRSRRYQAARFARRNPALVGGIAATLVVLLAGLVGIGAALEKAWAAEYQARASAEQAVAQAEAAAAANRFLSDALASEALGWGGKDVLMRDVLARAAQRLRDDPPSRLSVAATVASAIADSFVALGERVRADQVLREFKTRATAAGLSPLHPDMLCIDVDLAVVLADQGQKDEPIELLERSTAHLPAVAPERWEKFATAIISLAELKAASYPNRAAELDVAAERVSTLLRANGQDDHQLLGYCDYLRGRAAWLRAEYLESATYFETSAARLARHRGPFHPDVLQIRSNYAGALAESGGPENLARAAEMYRSVLSAARQSLPADHPALAATLNYFGFFGASLGLHQSVEDEWIAMLREAEAIQSHKLGDEHPKTVETRLNLVGALNIQKRWREMERPARLAAEGESRAGRRDGWQYVLAANNLVNALAMTGAWLPGDDAYCWDDLAAEMRSYHLEPSAGPDLLFSTVSRAVGAVGSLGDPRVALSVLDDFRPLLLAALPERADLIVAFDELGAGACRKLGDTHRRVEFLRDAIVCGYAEPQTRAKVPGLLGDLADAYAELECAEPGRGFDALAADCQHRRALLEAAAQAAQAAPERPPLAP